MSLHFVNTMVQVFDFGKTPCILSSQSTLKQVDILALRVNFSALMLEKEAHITLKCPLLMYLEYVILLHVCFIFPIVTSEHKSKPRSNYMSAYFNQIWKSKKTNVSERCVSYRFEEIRWERRKAVYTGSILSALLKQISHLPTLAVCNFMSWSGLSCTNGILLRCNSAGRCSPERSIMYFSLIWTSSLWE